MAAKKKSGSKSSFDATRLNGFGLDPHKVVIIGLDTKDGPEHPLYDERIKLPLKPEMVKSIMAIGVRQAITVMKDPESGLPVVVNGRRRIMHAREANKQLEKLGEPLVKVPALVERGDDNHMSHVMVALNEIQEEDPVLVKAAKAQRMYARCQDEDEVATAFGVTKTAIRNWLKIAELPADVKQAVNKGVLSANAAGKLHGMDRQEQKAALAEMTEQHEKTGKKGTGKQAAKKNKNVKRIVKPSAKDANAVLTVISNEKSTEFNAGVIAGIRYMLGDKVPELAKLLEG